MSNFDELIVIQDQFYEEYCKNNSNINGIGIKIEDKEMGLSVHLERNLPHNLPNKYKGVKIFIEVVGKVYT